MRVLHVIPYASPVYGGPVFAVARMAESLIEFGVEIDVATTTANGKFELDASIGSPVASGGAHYHHFPRQFPKHWMYSPALRGWLYRHVCEYDLVHVHGVFAYTTLPACAAARHAGKPYIITPHGMLDPWCLSYKWWKKSPYYNLLERRNLIHAAALHVTSSFERTGMVQLGFDEKTKVIPLSVSSLPSIAIRPIDKGSLSLLFMSRLDPIKGLPTLLDALALLRKRRSGLQFTLTIAGQGTDEYLAFLMKMVGELGLKESARFIGFVEGEEKMKALADADVFVLPSYHENFSLATAEAMGAGLPVIVSDQVGVAAEIRDAGAGFVVGSGAPEELANAIEKFGSASCRQVAGENGRRLVENRFSKKAVGGALLDLYESVLARSLHH